MAILNTYKTYDKTKQQHCKCIKEDMYTNTQAINIFALTAYPERHTKVWKSNSSNSNLKKNCTGQAGQVIGFCKDGVSYFFNSVSRFFCKFQIFH